MKKFKKLLKDKIIIFVALTLAQVFLFWVYGCEPKTDSMLDNDRKVDRSELAAEFEILLAQHQGRIKDLDRQARVRDVIFEQSLVIAQGGTVNPFGVITTVLAILGLGATADDVRLRRERKKQITYEPVKNT